MLRKLNVSAALWMLELDSELLFIGDAGNTEASRPSRRYGLEVPLYYRPNDRLTFDVELALTRSRFTEFDPAGEQIPGSIDEVMIYNRALSEAEVLASLGAPVSTGVEAAAAGFGADILYQGSPLSSVSGRRRSFFLRE